MGNTEIHWAKQQSFSVEIASSRLLLHTCGRHPGIWGCGQGSAGPASALHGPSPPRSLQSLQPASGNSLQPLCVNIVSVSTGLPHPRSFPSGTSRFLPHLLPFPSGESPHPSSLSLQICNSVSCLVMLIQVQYSVYNTECFLFFRINHYSLW